MHCIFNAGQASPNPSLDRLTVCLMLPVWALSPEAGTETLSQSSVWSSFTLDQLHITPLWTVVDGTDGTARNTAAVVLRQGRWTQVQFKHVVNSDCKVSIEYIKIAKSAYLPNYHTLSFEILLNCSTPRCSVLTLRVIAVPLFSDCNEFSKKDNCILFASLLSLTPENHVCAYNTHRVKSTGGPWGKDEDHL